MDDVVMPQMGESLAEGTIVRWLKGPGDPVERDEAIVEISTDKVDTDVPSPVAGVVAEILAQPGDTVAVGAVMARVRPRGAAAGATEAAPQGAMPPPEAASGHFKATHAPLTFQRGGVRAPLASGSPPAPAATARDVPVPANRSFSQAVLDAARAGGLPLDRLVTLEGSGRGGRVTKRDVERVLAARAAGAPTAAASGGAAPLDPIPPEYVYRPGPGDRRVPLSPVRRKIAQHMAWSVRISPHATAFAECDMSRAAAIVARDRERRGPAEPPVTYTVLVAAAAVAALAEFEVLNASVVGDDLVLKP
jgi:pyruvate dehydrogenase E2 component (dihydrolipoamide acetyltransferase)